MKKSIAIAIALFCLLTGCASLTPIVSTVAENAAYWGLYAAKLDQSHKLQIADIYDSFGVALRSLSNQGNVTTDQARATLKAFIVPSQYQAFGATLLSNLDGLIVKYLGKTGISQEDINATLEGLGEGLSNAASDIRNGGL